MHTHIWHALFLKKKDSRKKKLHEDEMRIDFMWISRSLRNAAVRWMDG